MNAMKLLLGQHRFDLIYKYIYVKNPTPYNKKAYLESIRAFNNYKEYNLEGIAYKENKDDFLNSFDELITSIKLRGFDKSLAPIPIGVDGEINDGAHRLSTCAALGIDITTITNSEKAPFDYKFFQKRGMKEWAMDYGALEYVKLNYNAYIVNLHSVTNPSLDSRVEDILNKYGFVYYKKNVNLTYSGYVNIKKVSYGAFWDNKEKWIGDSYNKYAGARKHAKMSKGKYPLRAFVFVCDSLDKVLEAKKEIRELYGIGNYSVHINDTHEEAIWLSEIYFNRNTLLFNNNVAFDKIDKIFDDNINLLKSKCNEAGTFIDDICVVGSAPLNAYFARHSSDLDYLSKDDSFSYSDNILSPHNDQLKYYSIRKNDIILNPQYHFYYKGVKICSLKVLFGMKLKRHEFPKDYLDYIRLLLLKCKNGVHYNSVKLYFMDIKEYLLLRLNM